MKLFKHSSGMIIAFGFHMQERKEDVHVISWSDADGKTWDAKADNSAGWNIVPWYVEPEFVVEAAGGQIVAYQPGRCIEMTLIGAPFVWRFSTMLAEDQKGQRHAA